MAKKQSKEDKINELVANIVQNMKYADKQPHLKYAYYSKITEDNYKLNKLIGKKKSQRLIKEAYEGWIE